MSNDLDFHGYGPRCESCQTRKGKQTINDGFRTVKVCNPCAKLLQLKKQKEATA